MTRSGLWIVETLVVPVTVSLLDGRCDTRIAYYPLHSHYTSSSPVSSNSSPT